MDSQLAARPEELTARAPIKVHGVKEHHRNRDWADLAAEEVRTVGYAVVSGDFDDSYLALARARIDAVYEQQLAGVGGEENLRRINDADVVRCLLSYDDLFLEFARSPSILAVSERLLGDYFILMSQNGIVNRPSDEHYQVTWHRDLNYQHYISSRPLALSALYVVDDFSEATGGTWLLPGSHKMEPFPSDEYVRRHECVVEASAGSIVIFDAMLFHRSGTNTSGHLRRAINHIYTLPFIKQQISLPSALGGKHCEDPFLRKLLGYDSEPGASAQEWRERKLKLAGISVEPAAPAYAER